jgi:outer membrane protein OmpA-like peptidoglycan-associated protein
MLASELSLPVDLSVETVPYVPLLVFKRGETALSADMKAALMTVRDIVQKDPSVRCRIEAYPEIGIGPKRQRVLSRQRMEAIADVLQKECQVSQDRIVQILAKQSRQEPFVRVLVQPAIDH